jgi:protein required for attachment to host cells
MSKRSALDSPTDSPAREAGKSRGPGWPRDDRQDDGRWADRGVVPRNDNGTGWVVVADEAIARILVTDDDNPGALRAERALTDPAAHAREGQLDPHDRGRRSGVVSSESGQPAGRNSGGGASLVASAGEEDVLLEAKSFARRVADTLAEACREKRFDELTIIAAPRFLGLLRKELDASVQEKVVCELDKDLIHESDADIAARLAKLRQGGAST